jgi:copper chaperone CopZ
MKTQILISPEISCGHCERTIKRALRPVEGIRRVEVDIPAQEVRLEYDEDVVDLGAIQTILEREGYPVIARDSASRNTNGGASCCGSCHL